MKYLVHFENDKAIESLVVGHKFSALARAFRAGFAVPPAVAISAEAHRYFLTHKNWPDRLLSEVAGAARMLGLTEGVSIRSSGIREDLEQQSFAGLYRSFLAVVHEKDLKGCIEQCWKSAESENVQSYTRSILPEDNIPLMGVILQQMVPAAFAGVAFSRNPMHPSRDEMVIEAIEGLAQNLVSGHTSPHRALVDRHGNLTVIAPGEQSSSSNKDNALLLTDSQWLSIADLVRQLEAFGDGVPLDIEWAIDDRNELWLLQVRAITALNKEEPIVPAGFWTRKIANDLWADRLTPFLAYALIKNAPRFDLSRTLKFLGIPVVIPTMTVINGYLYVNIKSLAQALAFIPQKFRIAELGSLFPPKFDPDNIPLPGLFKKISVAARSLFLPFREPGVNPFICLWLSSRHQGKINKRLEDLEHLSDATPQQAFEKILRALDTMAYIQITNQWPYSYATACMWILRWVVVDILGLQHSDFLRLLSKGGKNITIDIEKKFKEMSRKISRDAVLKTRFLNESPYRLAATLPEEFRDEIDVFLKIYGCRSPHRTLYVPRWAEAPATVIGILQSLIRHQDSPLSVSANKTSPVSRQLKSKDNQVFDHRPISSYDDILKSQRVKHRRIARSGVRLILRLTLRFLDLREDLRFLLDKVLYQIRKGLFVIGKQTGLGDMVLFLNQEELNQLVCGELSLNAAKSLALDRHKSFSKPFDPTPFYMDGQPVNEFPIDAKLMRGTGTSPGRVTGRARIVEDPSRADLKAGDILVARNADPGWTPVLSIVNGMVLEEGGLLNHCSIVARELGIPSIVGVRQATEKIPDGSLIMVDGGLGLVRLAPAKTTKRV
jgi:pyruvate,water dikinase